MEAEGICKKEEERSQRRRSGDHGGICRHGKCFSFYSGSIHTPVGSSHLVEGSIAQLPSRGRKTRRIVQSSCVGESETHVRSRVATRHVPEPIYAHSPLINPEKRYGPEFFDRLVRQPSASHAAGVPGWVSSYQTRVTDGKLDKAPPPLLETLPPPSELFRRKKKKTSLADRRFTSVENHIEELWKKQSSIDQLKTMKWGGYKVYEVEEEDGVQSSVSRADQERGTYYSFLDDTTEQEKPMFCLSPPRSPGTMEFPWTTFMEEESNCFLDRTSDGRGEDSGFLRNIKCRGYNVHEGNRGCMDQSQHSFFSIDDNEQEQEKPFFSLSSPRRPDRALYPWTSSSEVSFCSPDRSSDGRSNGNCRGYYAHEGNRGCVDQSQHSFFSLDDNEPEQEKPFFSLSSPRRPDRALYPWTYSTEVSSCSPHRSRDGRRNIKCRGYNVHEGNRGCVDQSQHSFFSLEDNELEQEKPFFSLSSPRRPDRVLFPCSPQNRGPYFLDRTSDRWGAPGGRL
ncbi:protein INCA1 [Dendropsophus ebraccatus]|uniref:protein INCA1 n=1 Tax=Dendropsophus ebraccatus TaxID=150705 RepID=UPI00383173F3